MEPSSLVIEITEANFESEILQASMQMPVLVDFWAQWCEPCKTLGPILEELAEAYGGAFRLAKVDVDANPMLASQFGAQSVPMVFALFQGGLVDRFTGPLPRQDLTRFIDSVLERCGVERPQTAGATEEASGETVSEESLRARITEHPEDGEALIALARLQMHSGQATEAKSLLERVAAAHEGYAVSRSLLAALDLSTQVEEAGGESALRDQLAEDPQGSAPRYFVACADGARGHFADAIEVFVGLVEARDAEFRTRAQRGAATLLEAAGRGDERIETHRRRLSRLLF